jgi:hypothetical protein
MGRLANIFKRDDPDGLKAAIDRLMERRAEIVDGIAKAEAARAEFVLDAEAGDKNARDRLQQANETRANLQSRLEDIDLALADRNKRLADIEAAAREKSEAAARARNLARYDDTKRELLELAGAVEQHVAAANAKLNHMEVLEQNLAQLHRALGGTRVIINIHETLSHRLEMFCGELNGKIWFPCAQRFGHSKTTDQGRVYVEPEKLGFEGHEAVALGEYQLDPAAVPGVDVVLPGESAEKATPSPRARGLDFLSPGGARAGAASILAGEAGK